TNTDAKIEYMNRAYLDMCQTLISRHYDLIFRIAWKWCGSRDDAEDITQDVCLRLARNLASFDGNARFSTWLYRVVLNATRDHHRRKQADARKLADWQADPTQAMQTTADMPNQDRQLEELWQAVRQLPQKQCETVMLVFGEELSHGEAAQILGCAEGTVASNIHDAKRKLRCLLKQAVRV
ncbi:MAG: sigma-70 family RNA polymerase sigma factor, partial [Pseudomonadota bacterium]